MVATKIGYGYWGCPILNIVSMLSTRRVIEGLHAGMQIWLSSFVVGHDFCGALVEQIAANLELLGVSVYRCMMQVWTRSCGVTCVDDNDTQWEVVGVGAVMTVLEEVGLMWLFCCLDDRWVCDRVGGSGRRMIDEYNETYGRFVGQCYLTACLWIRVPLYYGSDLSGRVLWSML